MAGATYPKPAEERQNRNRSDFTWTDLPASVPHPVPPLPALKPGQQPWSKLAVDAWEDKWTCPQSTQWTVEMKRQVEIWLYLYESFTDGDYSGATISGLARIEDKLGLNPKAMLQLRWRHHPAYLKGEQETTLASVQSLPARPQRKDPRKG